MSKAKAQKIIKLPKNYPQNENRLLVREGMLFTVENNKLQARWCFLFNDLFVETKPICDIIHLVGTNVGLSDPHTQFEYKNYIVLNTCYIQENQSILTKLTKQQHQTIPFMLIGNNLGTSIEYKLIYSTNERELWCNLIHLTICNIHSSINRNIKYGWQNQYRKGNVFNAVYTLNNDLVTQLISLMNIKLNGNLKDVAGNNLLHIAAAVNNADFISKYGYQFDIDALDCNGWSALRIGCHHDNIASVKVIVEDLYPDLDQTIDHTAIHTTSNRTILHELAMKGQSQLVKILLDTQQINLESIDKNGETPLHIACKENKENCCLLLLQYGASPNIADFKGNRPLHVTHKEEIARWLIAYGARLELANKLNKKCKDIWLNKLNKYIQLFQSLNATDCQIQANIVPTTAWISDKLSNRCLECDNIFSIWSRKHHCRICGLLVCKKCSSRKLLFNNNGKISLQRSCNKCFNKNHTKSKQNKLYNFNGKQYNMIPHEYYKMIVMETQFKGSYNSYLRYIKLQKENDEESDVEHDDEKLNLLEIAKYLNQLSKYGDIQDHGSPQKKKGYETQQIGLVNKQ